MTEPHSRSHGPDGRRLTSRRRGSSSGKLPTWNEFSRGPLPFLGVAFAGFAMAYLVIAIFVFPGGSGEEEVEIPNVVGLSYDEAVQRLGSYGFATDRAEERYDASAPAYTVIEQTPRAGITDVAGATIRLAVSRGQLRGEVPMVMGLTREEAAAVLEDAGLEVGDVSSREDSAPRGQVVGTAPSIGSSVPLPSAVNLVISTGPSRVEIPDVTGQELPHAQSLLEQLGLRITTTWDSLSYMTPNTVVGQSPAAGQSVRAGATVSLILAGRP
ncbi:MAG TPA: PASTA domain-containing protein [Gemmatimonadales bacterium]|nr:PASTA domain-containing protein [Gemmatimonadales bacterium]